MRKLTLEKGSTAEEWGQAHGESFRGEIASLVEVRSYLCQRIGRYRSRAELMEVARRHLPVLRKFDQDLYDEISGIAEGAALTPEEIIVLNHYTDLRDIDPRPWREAGDMGGCTAILADTPEGRLLGQTWDMHATALPYVMALGVPGDEGTTWLLTITGCLGMTGMNSRGLGVTINNLSSNDAEVGIVWPALVRRLLREDTAEAAQALFVDAPLGSGHHYLIADKGAAFGYECSGTRRELVFEGEELPYCHTNHCFNNRVADRTRVPMASTTHERLKSANQLMEEQPVQSAEELWKIFGSQEGYPKSVCNNMSTPENPHGTATCGAAIMNLETGEFLAQGGLIHNVEPESFQTRTP